MRIVIGIFIILHGLVHLLYFGQSMRIFELESGMNWPDGSWIFSKFLSTGGVRYFAGILCILTAIGFILSGIGLFFAKAWWQSLVAGSAVLSILLFLLFWDGHRHNLDDQGGYSTLINVAILLAAMVF